MEAWQRRYKERKHNAYMKYYNRLMKTKQPDFVRTSTFMEVIHRTAMLLAERYMTSLRTGERNV
tara:strand:- start:3625 stop:3816 length:192 start_codon:yes stop_codon:yes gene_type:complete